MAASGTEWFVSRLKISPIELLKYFGRRCVTARLIQ